MSFISTISIVILIICLYSLVRISSKNMSRESIEPGSSPNPWAHIFFLELILLAYVSFNVINECAYLISKW